MGIKTYIYRTEYANYQTRLVTSNGGHPIPYNSEVVVEFPKEMNDATIEFYLEQLNKGTPDFLNLGLRRYVFVCGEWIAVESYQSYQQSPTQGDAFSLKVQQWLDGKISQRGEDVVPIISSTISTTSLPSYLDKDEHDNTTGTFKLRNTQAEESNSFPLVYSTISTSSSSSMRTAIDERLNSLIRSSQAAISSTLLPLPVSDGPHPERIEEILASLIRSYQGQITAFTMEDDSNHTMMSEARENQSGIAAYNEPSRAVDIPDVESEVQTIQEETSTEMTRFGAKAKHLKELVITEEPSHPMIINQLRNVRQKWFQEEVKRIVESHRAKIQISAGEYAIDFDTMQEEVEERTPGLYKAVHKAKKKRAFPISVGDLDREDTRSTEQYSKDCKSLASQICQRALKELQQGASADKIVVLFSRGEKGQPSEKVVKSRANHTVAVGSSIEGHYDLELRQWHQKRNYFFRPTPDYNQQQPLGRKAILDEVTQLTSVHEAEERSAKRRKLLFKNQRPRFSFDVDLYLDGKQEQFSPQQIAEIWGHKKFLGKPDSFHLKRLKSLIEEAHEEKEHVFQP
ncbi:hypothetical protein ACD661_05710 [Legionella lytica]|uniref:Uncharacterized protein n=1 Tax=Legionella lytica TaxID=96232 RepID=A0ABW8D976_9GAMM